MQPDESSHSAEILEQMADAVIYAGVDGNIALWNVAACALFGYSTVEALGESLDLIIPEDLRQRHWAGFKAAVAAGTLSLQGRPTLTRAKHKDGRKLYVELTFALVKRSGTVLGAVAVARDATERIAAQRGTHHRS